MSPLELESLFPVFILIEMGPQRDSCSPCLLVACDLCVSSAPVTLFRVPRDGCCFSLRLSYLTEPWLLLGCLSRHKQSNQVSTRAVQTPRAVNRLLTLAKDIFCLGGAVWSSYRVHSCRHNFNFAFLPILCIPTPINQETEAEESSMFVEGHRRKL